jgi:hypothetical protein
MFSKGETYALSNMNAVPRLAERQDVHNVLCPSSYILNVLGIDDRPCLSQNPMGSPCSQYPSGLQAE